MDTFKILFIDLVGRLAYDGKITYGDYRTTYGDRADKLIPDKKSCSKCDIEMDTYQKLFIDLVERLASNGKITYGDYRIAYRDMADKLAKVLPCSKCNIEMVALCNRLFPGGGNKPPCADMPSPSRYCKDCDDDVCTIRGTVIGCVSQ